MRSFTVLPTLNPNDKAGLQTASTSDVRKLANRCWSTTTNTKPSQKPMQGAGLDGRPASRRSLPILPSQRNFNPSGEAQSTLHPDKRSLSGLGGSSPKPFPAIPNRCRTPSQQSSLALPRGDVDKGRRGRRKKPSRRYRQVFVWDHMSKGFHGSNSSTDETHNALQTDVSMKLAMDNQGRNVFTPKGQARLKRKQRTQGLLGMLEKPLKVDQLCKTPVPQIAWTNSSSRNSFPSNTVILPPIGQDYDTSTPGYDPRSERGLSEEMRVDQTRNRPLRRKTQTKKSLKHKMGQKGKLKQKDLDVGVNHVGTQDDFECEDDGDEDLIKSSDDSNSEPDDETLGHSVMGWTDDDDDEDDNDHDTNYDDDDDVESVGGFLVASRVNSQLRKSACSNSQFSRASGFTVSSVEIRVSGDDDDDDDTDDVDQCHDSDDDDDDDDGENTERQGDSQISESSNGNNDYEDDGNDNEDSMSNDNESLKNTNEDNDSKDDISVDEDCDNEDDTIQGSDDEEDDNMFVRISDYGSSEDENEEENSTDAGGLEDDEEEEEDGDNHDETSTCVEDDGESEQLHDGSSDGSNQ